MPDPHNYRNLNMFGLNLFKTLPSMINCAVKRTFRPFNRYKYPTGINQPPRYFRPGEERLDSMPDQETLDWRHQRSLYNIDIRGPLPRRKRKDPLDHRPQMRGIVLKTMIKKPKKPNSANRKCVYIKLSNGKETVAYVPGIGHNLQEHSTVLVKKHRVPDVPGLKLRVIRGVYDCSLVIKQSKQR